MLYPVTPSRGEMTQERKRIRQKDAAQRLGVQTSYLSQINKPGGILERAGVTVIREYGDMVMYFEDELLAWWKRRHPEWVDPGDDA